MFRFLGNFLWKVTALVLIGLFLAAVAGENHPSILIVGISLSTTGLVILASAIILTVLFVGGYGIVLIIAACRQTFKLHSKGT